MSPSALGRGSQLIFSQFPKAEVEGFRDQLKEIQATMVEGKFLAGDSTAPKGQDIVIGLLERCKLWTGIVLERFEHPETDACKEKC